MYGEKALWKAVIMQAILDLTSTPELRDRMRADLIKAKNDAEAWVNPGKKDFIKVCGFANLEPSWVMKKVDLAKNNPKDWRRKDLKQLLKETL